LTREPIVPPRRPTRDMQHHDHDLALIAALAAGDLTEPDRARAQATLDRCTECTAIHADLVALAAATRALPKHARAPRDFRLSPDQAARLRRGSWLRAFLAPLASAGSVTRPLAAAFTSLGVAGLLVVAVMPGLLGAGTASAPERDRSTAAGAPTVAPAAQPVDRADASDDAGQLGPRAAVGGNASASPDVDFGVKNEAAGSGAPRELGEQTDDLGRLTTSAPPNPLLVGSLALLAVGLLLFGLRFAGRRLR
jgi:anti-sigma factor RsiW